ncbi:MAG TPA: amidohydrolase family protein, partial [Pyrinomonadaceae bacterium]|nr:amidohydrolase family protein [Pyrinomonadaceae bacterium]
MPVPDLIIRGRSVVLPDTVAPRSIHIQDGRIVALRDYFETHAGCEVIDLDDNLVVMPGLVDTHVHINSPGRTDWEGFQHATQAAAAGGVTTLIDMPLN